MARYMHKYVGTYRVKADITSDNDFPRVEDGSIDPSFDDEYIECKHGCKIYHYGKDILQAYIPTIQRGRRAVKELDEFVIDVIDNGTEVLFTFKAKNIESVAEYLKAKTFGCNISPFSRKNLFKSNEKLSAEDEQCYREAVSGLALHDISSFMINFKGSKLTKIERENLKKSGSQLRVFVRNIGKFEVFIKELTKYKEGKIQSV